jgi:hypothetical protein
MYTSKEETKESAFKYEYVDRDLIAYMQDIISIFTTSDAQVNLDNKAFLVDRI